MVSKFQWKPFWLSTHRYPHDDWIATENRVTGLPPKIVWTMTYIYTYSHRPHRLEWKVVRVRSCGRKPLSTKHPSVSHCVLITMRVISKRSFESLVNKTGSDMHLSRTAASCDTALCKLNSQPAHPWNSSTGKQHGSLPFWGYGIFQTSGIGSPSKVTVNVEKSSESYDRR